MKAEEFLHGLQEAENRRVYMGGARARRSHKDAEIERLLSIMAVTKQFLRAT